MTIQTISLLSSDINNKVALSLLFDRQGYTVKYVNEGKLQNLDSMLSLPLGASDAVLVDLDVGLGDTCGYVRELWSRLEHSRLIILCDQVSLSKLKEMNIPPNVWLLEKPVLPDELLSTFTNAGAWSNNPEQLPTGKSL